MSSSGKSKKKAKWKSVALEDILPNTVVRPSQSWADEVEDELNEYTIKKITSISLPTAPRAATDLVIDESKIPPNGPFMAYLSNLPYEITEDDIAQHFSELKIANIQLPKDSRHDRMKGFGYVEFETKSALLTALNEGELTLKNRLVRISLPNEDEHKEKNSRSGNLSFSRRDVSDRMDGGEKNLGEWRAAAPIPHDPDKGGFTRPGQRDEPSGGSGRPFREARPFDPEPSGPFTRGGGGFRGERDRDRDFGGRSNDRDRDRDFGRSNDRDFGGRSNDRDFGGRSNDRDRDRDGGSRLFGKRYDRDDRGGGRMGFGRKFENRGEDREFVRREVPPAEKEEPKSRPRLDLQPRTKPVEPNVPDALPSSIFGGAKPVDTLKREMEIEAKLSAVVSQPAASRSRGSSPPPISTPRSNRSRSPSVSSISSSRRHDNDNANTAYETHQAGQSDNESKDSSKPDGSSVTKQPEFKEPPAPPTKNIWFERKAKAEAAAVVPDSNVSNASSSVIEKSNAYETSSIDNNAENRSQSEENSGQQQQQQPSPGSAENRLSSDEIYHRPKHHIANTTSDDDFIRYEPDHFTNPDAPSSQHSSNRGGGRYNDSKFNFGRDRDRDNRGGRDNRREPRGRRPDNGGQFRRDDRRDRDDNSYGGRSSDSNWISFGSGRGRNGGPRRGGNRDRDRDNGFYRGGDSRNSDSGANFSNRSSNSSITNLRDEDRYDSRRRDERLNDELRSREDDRRPKESAAGSTEADDRLKIIADDDTARKPVENGNENGVGFDSSEDVARKTYDSISTNEQSEFNDNSFSCSKNRKKDKKKKREGDDSDANDRASDKQRIQKDEKKKGIDNHQVIDKTNNKNNLKTKDKNAKKTRELRDDATPLPKAKEEKAPNFQDSNRFLFLENDE